MIEVGDLKKGMYILWNNDIYRVIDVNKHFMGRGSGLIRTKLKSVTTGYTIEQSFNSGEKVQEADLSLRKAQFLYRENNIYYFMTLDDYETHSLEEEVIGDAKWYLVENMEVDLQFYNDKLLGILLPTSVVLEVKETDPGFKGDTATAGNKPAKLETGITVQVPLFVNNGEIVRVDTRTGAYLERA